MGRCKVRWGEKGKGDKGDKRMGLWGCAGRVMGLAKKLQTNRGNTYHTHGYKPLGTRRERESKKGTRQRKVMVVWE